MRMTSYREIEGREALVKMSERVGMDEQAYEIAGLGAYVTQESHLHMIHDDDTVQRSFDIAWKNKSRYKKPKVIYPTCKTIDSPVGINKTTLLDKLPPYCTNPHQAYTKTFALTVPPSKRWQHEAGWQPLPFNLWICLYWR